MSDVSACMQLFEPWRVRQGMRHENLPVSEGPF
jgi:hypothetical protein